jgi:hypothetical protein
VFQPLCKQYGLARTHRKFAAVLGDVQRAFQHHYKYVAVKHTAYMDKAVVRSQHTADKKSQAVKFIGIKVHRKHPPLILSG